MALTVSIPVRTVFGNKRAHLVDITPDNSYPTGGESLTPADLGMKQVDAVFVGSVASGVLYTYDKANQKLKAFRTPAVTVAGGAVAAGTDALSVKANVLNKEAAGAATVVAEKALAEVAATTDLSAVTVSLLVIGN